MEIPEVPIGQEPKTEKKFSPKVLEETQRYLDDRGVSKDDLSQRQWKFVAGYIKGKHYAKRGLITMILATVLSMCLAFSTYKIFKSQAARLESIMPTETIIVFEDGTRKSVEFDRAIVEAYGKVHALMGFGIGFFIFLGISGFSFAVRFFVQMRMRDKMLDAFLPSLTGGAGELKGANEQVDKL